MATVTGAYTAASWLLFFRLMADQVRVVILRFKLRTRLLDIACFDNWDDFLLQNWNFNFNSFVGRANNIFRYLYYFGILPIDFLFNWNDLSDIVGNVLFLVHWAFNWNLNRNMHRILHFPHHGYFFTYIDFVWHGFTNRSGNVFYILHVVAAWSTAANICGLLATLLRL